MLWVLGSVCAQAAQAKKDAVKRAAAAVVRPVVHETAPPRVAPKAARLLNEDDGLSVIGAALERRGRNTVRPDCSHLVHAIYDEAGFAYEYASSADLYFGVDEFRRVKTPQPGDLVVWRGHVGIVISPAQHSFYSSLRSGLGMDAYDAPYWKRRGAPRFYRHVKGGDSR